MAGDPGPVRVVRSSRPTSRSDGRSPRDAARSYAFGLRRAGRHRPATALRVDGAGSLRVRRGPYPHHDGSHPTETGTGNPWITGSLPRRLRATQDGSRHRKRRIVNTKTLGTAGDVSAIGLGAMGMSALYGPAD